MSENQSPEEKVLDSGPTQNAGPVETETVTEMLNATIPKYQFKNEKNCYLTREELYRLNYINSGAMGAMAERDTESIPVVHTTPSGQLIRESYVVDFVNSSFAPEMHLDEMRYGMMNENQYDSVYRNGINVDKTIKHTDCLQRNTYIPIKISKPGKRDYTQLYASGNQALIHIEYFRNKIDQAILDRYSHWGILNQISPVSPGKPVDEIFEFSFPLLGRERGKNPKGKKENKYDFIKIVVSSITYPPNKYQTQFIIRTFRITNAKTHCTKRYFVGHYCEAYKEASTIYRKAANNMLELYDLDNVNDFIDLRISPDDPKIRFIPDGYFKDDAYVHDRDTNKYYTMGEWRLIEKKKAKERMKNQIKTRKRKVPLNKIPIEVITEKQKEHKDVLDFLNSL